jgi:guanine deaminase
MQVIASYGAELLDWLNTYTFPEETKFRDAQHGRRIARLFLDEMVRHGTTTVVAYCSVHKASAEAFFAESHDRNMLNIAGKVMMDRNAPDGVLDTPQSGYDDTKALIAQWHGKGRQHYAITPRFAITSSPEQMELAGALCHEHPDLHMQTHLSENHA